MEAHAAIEIRPYRADDRSDVMALAARLTECVASLREPAAVRTAVQGRVRAFLDSVSQPGHAVFFAADGDGIIDVVTVCERTHFTGQVDAYVGELSVSGDLERRGIASRLMAVVESWAAARGLTFLTLETGAADQPARQLYAALGYRDEDIRLTKAIQPEASGAAG
jgi:ribosomal protein S18 acetylase RimI-like enzyme